MNAVQWPFLVEAVLVLVAMVLGAALGRKAKPYGKVKLAFHLFFFLWFAVGYGYIAQTVWSSRGWDATGIAVLVLGLALVVQIVTGLAMLLAKAPVKPLPLVHGTSALVVLLTDLAAFVLSGF